MTVKTILLAALFYLGFKLVPNCIAQTQIGLITGFSYSQFRYDSAATDVEFYLAVAPVTNNPGISTSRGYPHDSLTFVELDFHFRNLGSDSVYKKAERLPVYFSDSASIREAGGIITVNPCLLPPGKYMASVIATDENNRACDTLSTEIEVKGFPRSGLSLSGVELCTDISSESSERDPYYKNTLHVVPNPRMLYGLGLPTVQFYAEVYGLRRMHDSTAYTVSWDVLDTAGDVLKHYSASRSGRSSDVVQIGSANVSDLVTGTYEFKLSVSDSISTLKAVSNRYFFVYNPYVKSNDTNQVSRQTIISPPFDTMSVTLLNNLFHAANYLETPEETNAYKRLVTPQAKRKFVSQFWAKQDSEAGPNGFNSWRTFYSRFKYANEQFRSSFTAGWLMDRGRVFIDYGSPDYIERHFSSADMKPYQIWTYNSIQGGVIFVFVDMTGFKDYVLVHSTMRGEVSNPDWLRSLEATPTANPSNPLNPAVVPGGHLN